MIYVASPYSSPILGLAETRYKQTCLFVDRMITLGFVAFSPIVYCHPIALRTKRATDAKTWHDFNMQMLRRTEAMYVLRLVGWEESKGLNMELKVCNILAIPVVHYSADFKLVGEEWKDSGLVEQF